MTPLKPAATLTGMMKNLATIVATVDLEGTDPTQVESEIKALLQRLNVRLVPCDWAPDPDVIADACGTDAVDVLDLNG